MRTRLLILMISIDLCLMDVTFAQDYGNDYPKIGEHIPNFQLHNIDNYAQKSISSDELLGSHTILWLWHRYCKGSYTHFDEIDAFAKKHKEQLKIFMVGGLTEKVENNPKREMDTLRSIFRRAKDFKGLKLPSAYDIDLYRQFRTRFAPTVIWIDSEGIVKAVTGQIKEAWIKSFLKDESFEFDDISYDHLQKEENDPFRYTPDKLFLIDNNGGKSDHFDYRSIITPFTNDMPKASVIPTKISSYKFQEKFEGVGPLTDLYKLAYLGRVYNVEGCYQDEIYTKIIYELQDTTKFIDVSYINPRKNMFWYSLKVPSRLSHPTSLMYIMQNNLKNYFGYNARVETRILPYWSVKLSKRNKLRLGSTGKPSSILGDWYTKIGAQNITVKRYLASIFHMIAPAMGKTLPIIDETNMENPIDVPLMDVDLDDFEEVRRTLRKQGFTIEKSKKEFKVLVIAKPDAEYSSFINE